MFNDLDQSKMNICENYNYYLTLFLKHPCLNRQHSKFSYQNIIQHEIISIKCKFDY
jgi:hypothetical protein